MKGQPYFGSSVTAALFHAFSLPAFLTL